jgi:hypothetical protein
LNAIPPSAATQSAPAATLRKSRILAGDSPARRRFASGLARLDLCFAFAGSVRM